MFGAGLVQNNNNDLYNTFIFIDIPRKKIL